MKEVKKYAISKSEKIEVSGTLFTVHSVKSENAKKDIKNILTHLILNNLDLLEKKCS